MPAISTVLMLIVLIGLGVWQLQRRAWKFGVLDAFAQAERNPPLPLTGNPAPFSIVSVTGTLRADLAASYAAELRVDVLGTQLIVPLERPAAPTVLADLGWVAGAAKVRLPSGTVTLTGFVRPGEHPGWFAATDNPARRLFYTLDPPAIGAGLGLPSVAPFTVVALGGPAPPGAPDPARHLPELPNNHLQYAITWFSLAAVLLAVFVLFVRRSRA